MGFSSTSAIQQAYRYAQEEGIRLVAITNGDYYLVFDRSKGLSYEENRVGEFTLSALVDDDLEIMERLRPARLTND